MLATLVEDWDEMTTEERLQVVGTVFAEIYPPDDEGTVRALPRDDWKQYMAAVLREPASLGRWGTERKTGLYPPNVETNRLVRDERGWLRLAG